MPDGDYKIHWVSPKTGKPKEFGFRKHGDSISPLPPVNFFKHPKEGKQVVRNLLKVVGQGGKTAVFNFGSSDRPINWKLFKLENPELYKQRVKALRMMRDEGVKSGRPFAFGNNAQSLIDYRSRKRHGAFSGIKTERAAKVRERYETAQQMSQARSLKVDAVAKDVTFQQYKADIVALPKLQDATAALATPSGGTALTDAEKQKVIEDQLKKVEGQLVELEKAQQEVEGSVKAYGDVLNSPNGPLKDYGMGVEDIRDQNVAAEANRDALLVEIDRKRVELKGLVDDYKKEGIDKLPPPPPADLVDKQKDLEARCIKCEAGVDQVKKDADKIPGLVAQAKQNFPQQVVRPK